MIKFLLTLVLILFAVPAVAYETAVVWQYSPEQEAEILGFRIYEVSPDGDIPIIGHIEPDIRREILSATVCTTYYIIAYDAYSESDPSNSLLWCPGKLITPQNFVREIRFTILQQTDQPLAIFKRRWESVN